MQCKSWAQTLQIMTNHLKTHPAHFPREMWQLQKIHLQPVKDGWEKERKITKELILHLFPFSVISQSPLSPAPTPLLRRDLMGSWNVRRPLAQPVLPSAPSSSLVPRLHYQECLPSGIFSAARPLLSGCLAQQLLPEKRFSCFTTGNTFLF